MNQNTFCQICRKPSPQHDPDCPVKTGRPVTSLQSQMADGSIFQQQNGMLGQMGQIRDPKRIDDILDALKLYWKENPDLRLTQIIGNCFGPHELYYYEDEEFYQYLLTTKDRQ
jgi:hypothetical protein